MTKQIQATNYIKNLLTSRKLNVEPGIVLIGECDWRVFDYNRKCLAIDPNAGVWIGMSGGKWNPLGTCTVSNALQAVDFLTKNKNPI
jgi:hypothetical protein